MIRYVLILYSFAKNFGKQYFGTEIGIDLNPGIVHNCALGEFALKFFSRIIPINGMAMIFKQRAAGWFFGNPVLAGALALGFYICLIGLVNWVYVVAPLFELSNGDIWSSADLLVGFVFVSRDFAQRRVGHHILWGTLAGSILSWWWATPQLALASAAAFAVGEMGDWALFTFTKRPFSQRILISSLIGCPLDSLVFLTLIDRPSLSCVLLMTASKLAASFLVYFLVRRRELRMPAMQSA